MITLRKGRERGNADRGWLKSCASFSFAEYHDPAYMVFASLRVVRGTLNVNGYALKGGNALLLSDETRVDLA